MDATSLKDRNRQSASHVEYLRRGAGMRACSAIISIEGERRQVAGYRSFAREFRGAHVGHGRLIIGTRSVRTLQGLVHGNHFEWLIRRLVRQFELLTRRQAY